MQVVDMDGTATGPGAFALNSDGTPGPCVAGKPCIAGTVLLTEANKSAGYQTDGTVRGLLEWVVKACWPFRTSTTAGCSNGLRTARTRTVEPGSAN